MNRTGISLANGLKCIAILLACTLMMEANAPQGWYLAGSKPAEYESGVDAQAAYNGHPSAYLKAKQPVVDGFGTLMQDFRAEKYAGKRVRLSALVKTDGVKDWAGLWMRVDKGPTMVAFDNMQDRPMKGTSDWRNYEVVLDVPQDATGIFFGVLLTGSGTVWLNNTKFEIVGPEVRTTGAGTAQRGDAPANLDFEN